MTTDRPSGDIRSVWQNQTVEPMKMSLEEIRAKAGKLERKIRRRNLALVATAVAIAGLGCWNAFAQHTNRSIAGIVVLAVALYLAFVVFRKARAPKLPPDAPFAACVDFYRAELEHQRDNLRGIWSWFAAPVLAAMIAFAGWYPVENLLQPERWLRVAPFLVLAVVWCVVMVAQSRREARKLQHQIDALEGLEKQG